MNEQSDNKMPVSYDSRRPKKSIFRSIAEVFQSDVFWFSVALGCVLGVVLFYFQGLQPFLLRYHIVETKGNLVKLERKYADQIKAVKNLQPKFADDFKYDSTSLCKDQQKYQNFTIDVDELDRLTISLLNTPKPNNIESVGTLPEVKNEYNRVYSVYAENMVKVRNLEEGFRGIPSYLNYINTWLEACQTIEASNGSNADVTKVCNMITNAKIAFDSGTKPFFWDEIKDIHQRGLNQCTSLDEIPATGSFSGFTSFKLEWLSNYARVRQIVPDFYEYLEPLNGLASSFEEEFARSDSELLSILDDRKSFGGMWYLLNYGDKSY